MYLNASLASSMCFWQLLIGVHHTVKNWHWFLALAATPTNKSEKPDIDIQTPSEKSISKHSFQCGLKNLVLLILDTTSFLTKLLIFRQKNKPNCLKISSLTFKEFVSTLHNIGHIVEKEKRGCVLNCQFVVLTLVQEDTRKNIRGSFWPGRGLGW